MRKAKVALIAMFTMIAAVAGAMTLAPPQLHAENAEEAWCSNNYCNPGWRYCDFFQGVQCDMEDGVCDGWGKCGVT